MKERRGPGNPIEIWARDLDKYFTAKGKNMANKHRKRCSISLVTKEAQI